LRTVASTIVVALPHARSRIELAATTRTRASTSSIAATSTAMAASVCARHAAVTEAGTAGLPLGLPDCPGLKRAIYRPDGRLLVFELGARLSAYRSRISRILTIHDRGASVCLILDRERAPRACEIACGQLLARTLGQFSHDYLKLPGFLASPPLGLKSRPLCAGTVPL